MSYKVPIINWETIMNIYPVNSPKNDKNRYCGPAVISILTGMTTGEAARLVRSISNSKLVKGTHTWEVLRALSKCGLSTKRIPVKCEMRTVHRKGSWIQRGGTYIIPKGELTLAGWLKETVKLRTPGRVFLIVAGQHWQIVTGRRYCCGRTREIVSINDERVKRRARVTEVYEIIKDSKVTIPAMARKPKAATRIDPARTKLEALLKKHGIPKGKVVPDGNYKDYVIPPCDHFRLGCSTIHYGWTETYYRIEDAIEHPITVAENDGHWSE